MRDWLFTILRNIWLNELRSRRNGPQLVEIDLANGVADRIVDRSKNSHDLYVSRMETEQVRAAIQELSVEFRELILSSREPKGRPPPGRRGPEYRQPR
jgi:RNA polymerase sigma-70 factor (ECF subfamily)